MKENNSDSDKTDRENEVGQGQNSPWDDIKNNAKRIKFWIEIFALIGLAIYTCETRRTNNLTRESLNTGEVHFRAEQRPWIMAAPVFSATHTVGNTTELVPIIPISKDISRITMTVKLTNYGRSPAVKISTTPSDVMVGTISDVKERVSQYTPDYRQGDETVLMVGDGITPHTPEGPTINTEQKKLIENGEWEIYIVGAVKYQDTYDPAIPPYETIYCFKFNPTGLPFGSCSVKPTILK